jgi:hypothetical protein
MKSITLALLACVATCAAAAAQPVQDPNWPCAQQLVPKLSAGTYWSGPLQPDPNWRDDPDLFTLVQRLTDPDLSDQDAVAKLNAYVDAIPAAERARKIPRLFAALVDQTNDEREEVIAKLKKLGLRQRELGDIISSESAAADRIQADATGTEVQKRQDLVSQRDFTIRAFQAAQRTMRYACEAPSAMERRLGLFAQTLQRKLGG